MAVSVKVSRECHFQWFPEAELRAVTVNMSWESTNKADKFAATTHYRLLSHYLLFFVLER
ncbi:MAG: hypothetical protein WC560_03555 [Syntrophales bacterium]